MSKVTRIPAHISIDYMQPPHNLKGDERYKRLYHFTSFDTFVKIWQSKRLLFSPVTNVNDIKEAVWGVASNNPQQWPLYYAYNDIRNAYKQISLTMDKNSVVKGWMSPLMWGVYGDKRKGVCIELDYSELGFKDTMFKDIVTYEENISPTIELDSQIATIEEVCSFIIKNRKRIFFTKQSDWSNEREYRIVSREDDYLDISQSITAVYLTSYESAECVMVEKLAGGQVPVRYVRNKDDGTMESINAKSFREHRLFALNDQNNYLKKVFEQAQGLYLKHKDDAKACLLLKEYRDIH